MHKEGVSDLILNYSLPTTIDIKKMYITNLFIFGLSKK